MPSPDPRRLHWPDLDPARMGPTFTTLHLTSQIVGKIRLARTPWINHSWHVPLYVSPRGLRTSSIPGGSGVFEVEFDLHQHRLELTHSDGETGRVELGPRPVAELYTEFMQALQDLGVATDIRATPSEIADGIPFADDRTHAAYEPEAARALHEALVASHRVFQRFRARFRGKSSPVHFFWGSFDLAVSRFSGREAPPHPAGFPALPDWVAREAYDREVSSLGFWPGDSDRPHPIFYSYCYPKPEGFEGRSPGPHGSWSDELGEFVLPYEAVRSASEPEAVLLDFAQATYEAATATGGWDRERQEWKDGVPGEVEA